MLFYEPKEEERIGVQRVRMAAEAGANVIVTACPFCMVNIEDAIKVSDMEGKMTAIDLADFSGKRWHQKDLVGKTVVIVSWATWCGPCRLQDAQLEKFYVKMKDRKDLAILGLNVDENPGEVRPFMQQHGYTFPVLAGSSFKQAVGLVPRTWIIDKQGNWRWVRNGFNEEKTYSDFETDLLGQIAKVSAGQ